MKAADAANPAISSAGARPSATSFAERLNDRITARKTVSEDADYDTACLPRSVAFWNAVAHSKEGESAQGAAAVQYPSGNQCITYASQR